MSSAVHENYKPRKAIVAGSKDHPTALVESAAMASVDPPPAVYRPSIPEDVVTSGKLSSAQLESIIYAGQAHDTDLPDGSRQGYFIGDGTGVGKGREISGVILDNIGKGREKHLWVSEKPDLIDSAKRDFGGVGGDPAAIFPISKIGGKEAIKLPKGIGFVSYATLRGEAKGEGGKKGKSRLDQIVDWLGKDFDGVIAFDEAHNMANAVAIKQEGSRGAAEVSQTAKVGLELQRLLPKARVLYVSATGATEVRNLAYATRLGLWGEGAAFPTKEAFINKVSSGGIASMEMIARDLKAMGLYTARSQSFAGVKTSKLTHELTPTQREMYDAMADGWALVYKNIGQALALTTTNEKGKVDSRARAAALSQFYGAQQRFWNQILSAMQMPSILKDMEKQLSEGHACVLQFVNTDEAQMTRALATQGDTELEDLDLTPRQALMDYIQRGFPVSQMEEFVDETTGKKGMRPVVDSQGNQVTNPEAVALREGLLDKLGSIKVPDGPLDMLIDHFGPTKVAEITGRKQRRERTKDSEGSEKVVMAKRRAGVNKAEEAAFNSDAKQILAFSKAGGTGSSYHADKNFKNQRLRVHYLVQPGWQADKAMQGLGRTKRTNERQPPEYKLVTTDIPGHKRFISSIARRLEQLGALTEGQRQSKNQGLFSARDNLENGYSSKALTNLYHDIVEGKVKQMSLEQFTEATGLRLVDENGHLYAQLPPIKQFLNRLLSLRVDAQNIVFGAFEERLNALLERAQADGTLDVGVENMRSDGGITKISEDVIHSDKRTGAQTKMVKLEVRNKSERTTFAEAQKAAGQAGYFVRNKASGRVYAVSGMVASRTDFTTGDVRQGRMTYGVKGQKDFHGMDQLDASRVDAISVDEAQKLWDAEYAKIPDMTTEPLHMITGAILPVWDRLSGAAKVWKLQTDTGERLLGRVVAEEDVPPTLSRFNINRKGWVPEAPDAAVEALMERNYTLNLSNGWRLKRSGVAGENQIEIIGPDYQHTAELIRQGVISERIAHQSRYFIRGDAEKQTEILTRVLGNREVIEAVPAPKSGGRGGAGTRPGFAALPRWLTGRDSGQSAGEHFGLIRNVLDSDTLSIVGEKIKGTAGALALHSLPKITAANRAAGEAGVRFASSAIAARPIARSMLAEVFQNHYRDSALMLDVGAVLTEDNLRSVKSDLQSRAQEEADAGNIDQSQATLEEADAVHTLVGPEGHFKDELAYQNTINKPDVQAAIQRWKQVVNPWMDEQYKKLQDIEPDEALPPRGEQLGARINLKAIRKTDKGVSKAPGPGQSAGNLSNSLKRNSPFAAPAKGNAEGYDINPANILENTVTRQWEQANKRRFYDALVEAGLAKYGKPGAEVEIGGKGTVGYPIQRRTLIVARGGKTIKVPQNQTIYVRADVAPEVRRTLNVDPEFRNQLAARAAGLVTGIQLKGPVDFATHIVNILGAITTRPGVGGSILGELALRSGGYGAMFPVAIGRTLSKAIAVMRDSPAIREKIAELATIGATRNLDVERGTWKWTKLELPPKYQLTRRAIEIIDLAGRLVMDDMYQFGVRRLGFKNNETQRREFINQIGRYNHRVQGLTMAAIVRSGLGPFAVAGTTFNLLGVRNVTGRPGVSAKSKAAAVGLWIATLAPLISTFVIARMVNQAITGDPNGRHGVPVGAVDTGLDNKDGRPIYVDLFKYGGARRGARILGLNAAMNKWANPDIPAGQAVAQAFKESGNTLMHPALGPAVQAMSIFTQRRPIGIETPEVVAAPRPDESGMYERVMGALTHGLNPIASAVGKAEETQTSAMESIRDTLGRTAGVGTASTTTQAAIHGARLRDYAEDVARRAKRIPIEGGQRIRFIAESVSGLPPKDAARVRMIVLRERGAMLSR